MLGSAQEMLSDLNALLTWSVDTGSSSAHCSSVRSLEYGMSRTVPSKLVTAVTTGGGSHSQMGHTR